MVRIVTSKTRRMDAHALEQEAMRELDEEVVEAESPVVEIPVPSLYAVVLRNPYVKPGRFVRRFEDGYEECVLRSPNGRLQIVGYTGPVWPHATLAPFLIAVKRNSFDWGSARQDRRRQMEQVGG